MLLTKKKRISIVTFIITILVLFIFLLNDNPNILKFKSRINPEIVTGSLVEESGGAINPIPQIVASKGDKAVYICTVEICELTEDIEPAFKALLDDNQLTLKTFIRPAKKVDKPDGTFYWADLGDGNTWYNYIITMLNYLTDEPRLRVVLASGHGTQEYFGLLVGWKGGASPEHAQKAWDFAIWLKQALLTRGDFQTLANKIGYTGSLDTALPLLPEDRDGIMYPALFIHKSFLDKIKKYRANRNDPINLAFWASCEGINVAPAIQAVGYSATCSPWGDDLEKDYVKLFGRLRGYNGAKYRNLISAIDFGDFISPLTVSNRDNNWVFSPTAYVKFEDNKLKRLDNDEDVIKCIDWRPCGGSSVFVIHFPFDSHMDSNQFSQTTDIISTGGLTLRNSEIYLFPVYQNYLAHMYIIGKYEGPGEVHVLRAFGKNNLGDLNWLNGNSNPSQLSKFGLEKNYINGEQDYLKFIINSCEVPTDCTTPHQPSYDDIKKNPPPNPPVCPNGIIEVGEECDPPGSFCGEVGMPDGTFCQSYCRNDCSCGPYECGESDLLQLVRE